MGGLDYVMYKGVDVAGVKCHMFLFFPHGEDIQDKCTGLQMLFYTSPAYSMLAADKMLTDYDSFMKVLKKKYSSPKQSYQGWTNDDYKILYSKATGAKMGLYKQLTLWEKKDLLINLAMNNELAEMMPKYFSESTVWVSYFNPAFVTMMNSKTDKSDGGL